MSKHVFLIVGDMPKLCPEKKRIIEINNKIVRSSLNVPKELLIQEDASDVRSCFYCSFFSGIDSIGAGDLKDRRKRYLLSCELKRKESTNPFIKVLVE